MAASNGQGRRAKGARQGNGPGAGGGVGTAGGAVGGSGSPDVLRATLPSEFPKAVAGEPPPPFVGIQQQILDSAQRHGFGEHCLFALKVALEEALVNAIKHGNKLDKRKSVTVDARITPKRAEITIEDQGAGFERSHVPDPLAEENLEKPSGRGILLIESYMTQVSWDQGGRRLRMVKDANDHGPGCTVG